MDLQGALKETPSTGIKVGRRPTSLRNSEPMYSFRKYFEITYLNARSLAKYVKLYNTTLKPGV